MLKNMTIQRAIQVFSACLALILGGCIVAVLLFERGAVEKTIAEGSQEAAAQVLKSAKDGTAVIAQDVLRMCRAQQDAIQQKVDDDLNVARYLLNEAGAVTFAEETATWQATDQYTKQTTTVRLPKMMVGDTWLGQNADMSVFSPVVDPTQELVGGTCTIFQRMNEAGDMLRVCTNVAKLDGTRAIGTYIPAVGTDGEPNPVISTVMKGETYRGRAYVVNAWYITAYEPILDFSGRVVGVLYVGAKQENVDSLRAGIMDIKVGKTGYVYVLGGTGEQRGDYIISLGGARDGENIWEAKDSDGTLFIQEIIQKAKALEFKDGEEIPVAFQQYPWKNQGEDQARMKIAAITYFEPWDWVIGAGTYESDYAEIQESMEASFNGIIHTLAQMIWTSLIIILVLVVAGIIVATFFARRISKPITQTADMLKDISQGEGDLTARLAAKGENEIGRMARYFNLFVEKLQGIIGEVATNTSTLASTSEELSSNAGEMNTGADKMNAMSSGAAAAVEQLSSNLTNIASGAEEMSTMVTTVATAVEEMSSSLSEVAKNCAEGARMSSEADGKARAAGETMGALNTSAEEIGKVIEAISDIADQTKLLALNATIEAASAGEAGKGFAVVANEVKELARQTAQATEEIGRLIGEMQNNTTQAVGATGAISELIGELNRTVQTIASAVEEQSATTNEIAQNVGNASQAATDISRNIQEASGGANEVSRNIQGLNEVAGTVKSGAEQTNTGSNELAEMAARLRELVGQFKTA